MSQSPECILSTLNLRALELTKLACFDAAIDNANTIQQISPSSARGYICAAPFTANKENNAKSSSTLQHIKDDAIRRQNKRIDFIYQLPVEIVVTSLIPLFMDDDLLDASIPYPYMHVSKGWRDRIRECFGGLRFMVDFDDDRNTERCSQAIQFAQYAKGLIIAWYSQGTWLSDLLRGTDFCMLHDLHINGFANIHDGQFLSSLASISNTLTHLYISLSIEEDLVSTADIVSACPNLVTLGIVKPFDADLSSLPMTTWPNMKILSITQARKSISSNQVVEISKRFPSLKRLTLLPCDDTQAALVLPGYCPSISRLQIRMIHNGVQLTYSDEGYPSDQQGITALSIHGFLWTRYSDQDHDIISLLKHYHNQLIHLEWDIVLDINDNDVYSLQYPQLKKLVLNRCGWWIPPNAPILEELEITSDSINTNANALDTISPHTQILKLRLHEATLLSGTPSVEHYLNRLGKEAQLKELVIHFNIIDIMDGIGRVLDAICGLNKLTRLEVGFANTWDAYQMERFIDELVKGCPHLSRLEIKCDNAPSTHSVNTLKRLKSLKQMAFSIKGSNDDRKFWTAMQTFSQLKCITIYPADAINENEITRLKEQRPDIEIIVKARHVLL